MKLVLKIAAGVFLGIFAAFCVYIGIDSWESHERSKAYAEQQMLEAEARKKSLDKAALMLGGLSSNKVRALCGVPIRERLDNLFHPFMRYAGVDGEEVDLEFSCYRGDCSFLFTHLARRDWRDSTQSSRDPADYADYETYLLTDDTLHNDHAAQIRELPCLADAK